VAGTRADCFHDGFAREGKSGALLGLLRVTGSAKSAGSSPGSLVFPWVPPVLLALLVRRLVSVSSALVSALDRDCLLSPQSGSRDLVRTDSGRRLDRVGAAGPAVALIVTGLLVHEMVLPFRAGVVRRRPARSETDGLPLPCARPGLGSVRHRCRGALP
jgi:hypothetical protein